MPRMTFRIAIFTLLAACPPVAAQAQVVEKVETYAISGNTGGELYASIGQHGPKAGNGRAIAFTTFKLTWTRRYAPQPNGACTITTARPKLIITYLLPKPSTRLSGATASAWQTFYDGVAAHERVHGDHIKDMVREIEAFSLGLTVDNDPKCAKIRTVLTARLSELSQQQRQRSRDFDRDELGEGGAVQRLVLALVNGG